MHEAEENNGQCKRPKAKILLLLVYGLRREP